LVVVKKLPRKHENTIRVTPIGVRQSKSGKQRKTLKSNVPAPLRQNSQVESQSGTHIPAGIRCVMLRCFMMLCNADAVLCDDVAVLSDAVKGFTVNGGGREGDFHPVYTVGSKATKK
jgi:hypothetical protein